MVEEEFSQLNNQYITLVDSAKSGTSPSVPAMLHTITQLQTKASQLRAIDQAVGAQRGRVYSPDAVERKTAAMKVLRDLREMKGGRVDAWDF